MLKVVIIFSIIHFSLSNFPNIEACGYQSCNPIREGMLNVHIVCHTHMDTGWVETYDSYYYNYVKIIYDSVIRSLFEAQNRKFIAVESSFFSRWYNEQSPTIRNRVHWLVRTGQLEFISGGWSMNDEAATHYSAIIDNLSYGARWLNRTFGQCATPKIGWQIDPFGHSREQGSIFSQMAFDGLFLGRIDFQDKVRRDQTKNLEFVWKTSPSLGPKADLFTGVLPNVYWPPKGFCYDVNCVDELIYDDNAARKAREFINLVRKQAKLYVTNHTIITMGMDFYYRDANRWFTNLDRLMHAVNGMQATEGVNVIYSTPSCYLKAIHDSNVNWSVKTDDFFPYADAYNAYWTGYFTSRPSLKFNIKYANNLLQSAKQLTVISKLGNSFARKLIPLQEALGLLQHHDSVTGTCKQFVNDDYIRILSKAIGKTEELIADAYHKLLLNEGFVSLGVPTFCNELNISQCLITERINNGIEVIVTVYNPLAHPVQHYMRIPVRSMRFRVRDASNGIVQTQLVPINNHILYLPERYSIATSDLIFQAILPPLGFSSFIIDKLEPTSQYAIDNQMSQVLNSNQFKEDIVLKNGKIQAVFDATSGLLKSVILKNGRQVQLNQNFYFYEGEDNYRGEKPSGAYAFNPTHHIPHMISNMTTFKVIKGQLVEEIHQTFAPWITQVVRLYRDYDYIEFDWVIGPIPLGNWKGKEIITRYESNFQSNQIFFTDSNGRETLRRIRHYRPTWPLYTTENVSSNYYPVTSWIFIRDHPRDLQLTVLTDRSQGGSSIFDGSVELMLHRRLLNDDGYGMEEALNEPGHDRRGLIVRGKHRVIVNGIYESVRQMKTMSKTLTWKPIPTFKENLKTAGPGSRGNYYYASRSADSTNFVGINELLPKNIHLLTLEPWDDMRVLIRLEHFFEINEDFEYSKPAQVSLRNLFTSFRIIDVIEMTLSANQEYRFATAKRFKWTSHMNPNENYTYQYNKDDFTLTNNIYNDFNSNNFTVVLHPMEIRTFLVRIEPKKNCFNGMNIPRRHSRRHNMQGLDC